MQSVDRLESVTVEGPSIHEPFHPNGAPEPITDSPGLHDPFDPDKPMRRTSSAAARKERITTNATGSSRFWDRVAYFGSTYLMPPLMFVVWCVGALAWLVSWLVMAASAVIIPVSGLLTLLFVIISTPQPPLMMPLGWTAWGLEEIFRSIFLYHLAFWNELGMYQWFCYSLVAGWISNYFRGILYVRFFEEW